MTATPDQLNAAYGELGASESSTSEEIAKALGIRVREMTPGLLAALAEGSEGNVVRVAQLLNAVDLIARDTPEGLNSATLPVDRAADSNAQAGMRKIGTDAPAIDWPALPSVKDARTKLRAWAASAAMVDPQLFETDVELSDATICRATVTRLIEGRREDRATVPGERIPLQGSYRNSINLVEVHQPTAFESQRWELVLEGSVSTHRCPSGCLNGQQRCTSCGGQGAQPCPPAVRCSRCSGSGMQARHTGQGPLTQVRCSSCAGSGQVICSRCRGTGQTPCPWCRGQGWKRCKPCSGTGVVTEFVKGTIEHRPIEAQVETSPPPDVKMPKHGGWIKHGPFPGKTAPSGLPDGVRSQLEAELEKQPEGELLRKVEIEVFPIVRVAYDREGESKKAYLLGADQAIQAPGTRKLRTSGKLGIALLLLVAVAVAVALAATRGSSDTGSTEASGAPDASRIAERRDTPRTPESSAERRNSQPTPPSKKSCDRWIEFTGGTGGDFTIFVDRVTGVSCKQAQRVAGQKPYHLGSYRGWNCSGAMERLASGAFSGDGVTSGRGACTNGSSRFTYRLERS